MRGWRTVVATELEVTVWFGVGPPTATSRHLMDAVSLTEFAERPSRASISHAAPLRPVYWTWKVSVNAYGSGLPELLMGPGTFHVKIAV